MEQIRTKPDPGARGWVIRDEVVRLRVFGTDTTYELAGESAWTIGASDECSIRLDDPSGRVSRKHAVLQRRGTDWVLSDLGSTNGIRRDGDALNTFAVAPASEIELGGVKLIAESMRSIQLRALLCRFLGWKSSRAIDVDRGLYALRELGNLRTTVTLRGEGTLVGIARRLHATILGAERPYIVHADNETGMQALARATDGILVVHCAQLPVDIEHVVLSLRLPDTRVGLVALSNSDADAAKLGTLTRRSVTIPIPSLAERREELGRVLEAYAVDAVSQLGAASGGLRPHDLQWILDSGITTHADAEEVLLRVIALRNWGVTHGANRLGITHGALSRWARRRGIPT
ncbi:MAG TPA: FHA domain-containing protein [Kofleriaceae bacterium]|nr:FHA domain-containing protein [Kofleriaceae bacterium]